MGVQGLWHLLQPCARPTALESLEGRRLAIDSSIWLYHFQMAMRDKEGRTLSNAHILGFLWRILKLIHFGIRPIFVFDGGAPIMKRRTLVGRRQRKSGAKDDHRRIAERLLNARLREAAVSHVAGGSSGASGSDAVDDATPEGGAESHGLGQNTVYFDDLNGSSGVHIPATSTIPARQGDDADFAITADDGAKSKEVQEGSEAQKKKKRNDWHKDPYALPTLERDINTITATNSTAAKNARGGGKRHDVRFATEGELRALLSSIGPTDLDLDSDFFRSLPSELQYELVGDMRAASRGTSYRRLQAMLSQSPTPIDFSRAQIAGLKTRNELTQKVLEVTDEIGDAHIKVPIRVAGARNREYVLVRNKDSVGGFALGVRESGTTQDKAIAVDEDTASATTAEEDLERRTTDEEMELEEVSIEASPEKSIKRYMASVPPELLKANPNDPVARKEVARELLERRAKELQKEKAKEQGQSNEAEELEDELRRARQRNLGLSRGGKRSTNTTNRHALFRGSGTIREKVEAVDLNSDDDTDVQDDDEENEWADLLDRDEAADLAQALEESQQAFANNGAQNPIGEIDEVGDLELEEVPTHTFGAVDYSSFYNIGEPTDGMRKARQERTVPIQGISATDKISGVGEKVDKNENPPKDVTPSPRAIRDGPSLGFRLQDRKEIPEILDPSLLVKRRWEEDEIDGNSSQDGDSRAQSNDKKSLHVSPSPAKGSDEIKWKLDHNRVIAISDSASNTGKDVGDEDVTIDEMRQNGIDNQVTLRLEKEVQSDADAEESKIKVVDYQDISIRQSETASSELDQKEDTKTQVRENSSSENGLSDTARAAGRSRSLSVLPSRKEDDSVPRNNEGSLAQDMPTVDSTDQEHQEQSEGEVNIASPIEAARRAGNLHTSRAVRDLADALLKETGADVTLDNAGSAANEVGVFHQPGIEGLTEQEASEESSEGERESEADHSDYSNREFGRNRSEGSDSPSSEQEIALGPDGFPLPTTEELAAMEAEDEAELGELDNDQDEFVSFLSRAKGQGLHQIRKEVEEEVNKLRSEHATTRRTEGEVTQQMAKEIQFMLRLFGLPYITAPMEAEAQCAELIALKLADGIITDDSDVFLFGGTFIYKNMFNNKKYVECYKLSDLQHDLGMDRTKLVQLAYLLGSDYTEGIEGVGPVLAMEILSHFPGEDGLVKFREWWLKVQRGTDTVKDTYDSTLKRLKRTLRNKVHLETHWPDPNVIEAYFEPTVDSSKEPFQWGLPDLDSLRSFFKEYLRWDQEKTDHYLIPAIEEQNRRAKRRGTQSTLDRANFFDLTAGHGAYAARKRTTFASSRLQQVIKNFRANNESTAKTKRKQKAGKSIGNEADPVSVSEDEAEEAQEAAPEELLGKEMGQRSRPVVRRGPATSSRIAACEEDKADDDEASSKLAGKKMKNGAAKGQSRKRKASDTAQKVHDEEWRPKTRQKPKPKRSTIGTTLSQARNMSLDNISTLPPSRASGFGTNGSTARDTSQTPIVLSDADDQSSLSEEHN